MTTVESAIATRVQALIDTQVAEGRQVGVQVCVYQHGQPVVDAVAGQMGPDDSRPIQPDSLVLSYSVTKGVSALALHILADRGLIDYDAPVAKYWPAFSQNGKESVTVAQAMSHQAGLHAMPEGPFRNEWITDWDAGIKRMEEGVPAYTPGTSTGYHAVTFGWIAGGIIQGATGRHIQEVIATEIAQPLGIEDEMFVGIPDGVESRLATLEIHPAGEGAPIPPEHDFFKAMPFDMWEHFNDMDIRKACLPSGNGHFSARALAKMYAVLAQGGELGGVRLVSKDRIPHMQRLMTNEVDRVLMTPTPKGIGFWQGGAVNGVVGLMGPRSTAFGHPGAGGSIAFCDPEVGVSVAVVVNKMAFGLPGEGTSHEICSLIRTELGT